MMPPSTFLPQAERDSALMAELSRALGEKFVGHVNHFVARHGRDWLPYGYAYNIAAIRFRDPSFVESLSAVVGPVSEMLREGKVTLEVTEGALMDIEHEVPAMLAALRAVGYKIALDDFGTGHSSLGHIRNFPLDTIKIDQIFTRNVDTSATDRAIIRAVSEIAATSGTTLVIEGVETEEQRQVLLTLDPDLLGQGWLFSKVLPAHEFEAWVVSQIEARDRKPSHTSPTRSTG